MLDELVLAVSSNLIDEIIGKSKNGLYSDSLGKIIQLIGDEHVYIRRELAEKDASFKQIIPYGMITWDDTFLMLKRTTKQNETRLHNKYSIGIGGHINPSLNDGRNNLLLNGLMKELNEEVFVQEIKNINLVGFINDNSTDVGRHHLGVFYTIELVNTIYEIIEKDKMEGTFVKKETLAKHYDFMESWSTIVLDKYLFATK